MTDYPTDPGAYAVIEERANGGLGAVTAIHIEVQATGERVATYDGEDAVDDLIRRARERERGEPGTDKLPSVRVLVEEAMWDAGLALDAAEEDEARALDAAEAQAPLTRDLVAALRGLLECAELNQDDMEGDTRMQIENARAVLARVEG